MAAVEEDHDALHHQLHPTAVTAAVVVAAAATAVTAVATGTDQARTGESTPRNPKWVVS